MAPTPAPKRTTSRTGTITGTADSLNSIGPQSTVERAMVEPIERLIPPVRITASWATPIMARKEAWLIIVERFAGFKNPLPKTEKNAVMAIKIKNVEKS